MTDFSQSDSLDPSKKIKTTKVVYPQLYSYTLPELAANEGSQKIGYTERRDVNDRIREQTQTAAMRVESKLLWSGPAFYESTQEDFKDKTFHKFLIKSGIEHRTDLGTEWFYFNGTPEKSKQLFDTFRQRGFVALQQGSAKEDYVLRTEQLKAVEQAKNYFETHENGEFLWNAKPRFGKTLASYDLAKQLGAKKVLIVTNRPAIANSWFDDFDKFIDGYSFISETSSLANRPTLTRDQYNALDNKCAMITFLSLQDLKGSKYFGGGHDKLAWVADLEWDLLVVDEAHEGIDTDRTDGAFTTVKRQHTLHLSGTPFKALANNKFAGDAIFNWTYLDEQKEKEKELEKGESGPHTDLPDLKLYTYRISQMTADDVNEGIEIDDESRDYAFDLNEFFATKNKKFTHESDVKAFLKNLTTNPKYPFSTPELRDQLRHTFWYIGNRVESVKALEQLLKDDETFKDYKVVVAAGDGQTFEEEESDFKSNEKSFDRVKAAIKAHPKTITLSCGQLTTGVTVKEWSAVLMLTDIKTPAQYMQAAFRAQNPYKFYENDSLKVKESAYLFDFAPSRVLEIYDQFANALNPKAIQGEITDAERKQNIRELLNFFPVISEDVDGQMVELDAEKVLTFPNALAATEIVKARFMTNLLFNDNIKGVFHFPKEVEEILDKMDKESGKRAVKTDSKLDLDDTRKLEIEKTTKINENSNVILGQKIYQANIERVVGNALNYETPAETLDTLADSVMAVAEPVIELYKDVYKATAAEIDSKRSEIEQKAKLVVAEYESSEIKDGAALKESLIKIIEEDFVQASVEQKETDKVEQVQKTKEEEVREHLRAFTRTIPMFVMANASRDAITIDNFDEQISDEDFIDLTNITKAEFHKLRDGFDYEEAGERKRFDGVFEKYRFNASIAEFIAEKKQRADYFKASDDIFELIPNQKNNQIFTPKKVVQMMIDGLETEQPELFRRTDSTFIDLYMKSGMYITEIVKKLFANTRHNYSSDAECLKHILENQVYGLAPTGVLHGITNSYILGFDTNHDISGKNFAQHDLLPQTKDSTAAAKLAQLFGNGGSMIKFDAVVGNPPYQISTDTNFATPVYNLFIDAAQSLNPSVVMLIHPARFLFNAGATPKDWNQKMLNDPHFSVVKYEADSQKIFAGVDIKGGIAVTMWDKNQTEGGLGGIFVAFDELRSVLRKVGHGGLHEIVSTAGGSPTIRYEDKFGRKRSYFRTSAFFDLPDVFSNKKDDEHQIEIVGLEKGNKRSRRFVSSSMLNDPTIEKWKVFVPESNGTGAIGEIMSTPLVGEPLVGEPLVGCTESFIRIGAFDTETEAQNCMKYIKSKFARAMLGTLKITQHNPKSTWRNVPLQDFTPFSDIDWTKSISEIDQQLYRKYNLSQDEIDFIEARVKEMV